ncbi:hypothetical protein ACOSP7_009502 [Xanthoceras sorbifolium]|uniref:Pectinesterase inhibitor domain-containing protein n=1 Tax=Xanthoceras sorbifolium TaxID=99658 RepID=A0ABQ8HUY7_9ROSI|nr:hypothetical protein JRO89_XS07G0234700 [Xanthoceras sorbifolium]
MASHFHTNVLIQITICFFLLLLSLSPIKANLVNDVCKDTQNPTSCVSALELDAKATSTTDLKALAKMALQLAVSNSTNSKKYIEEMAGKTTEPALKKALETCVSNYVYSVGSFNSALEELDEDMDTATYDAKVAGDGAQYCEDALAFGGVKEASVSTRNGYVFLYSDIGFVITNKLDV